MFKASKISITAILISSITFVGCASANTNYPTLNTHTGSNNAVEVNKNGVKVGGIVVGKNGIKMPSGLSTKTNNYEGGSSNPSIRCSSTNPIANVTGVNREVSITGKCTNINVTGTNLEVVAEQADRLVESGANNNIDIMLVNSINVRGTNSGVRYTSTINNKPAKVSITGVNADVKRKR